MIYSGSTHEKSLALKATWICDVCQNNGELPAQTVRCKLAQCIDHPPSKRIILGLNSVWYARFKREENKKRSG